MMNDLRRAPPAGYTKQVLAECDGASFPVMVHPGHDLDEAEVKLWDMGEEEIVTVDGRLWIFHDDAERSNPNVPDVAVR